MTRYLILKDFKGSQDGRFADDFKAGTEADLSDYLAGCVDPAWIRRLDADAPEQAPEAAVPPAPTSAPRRKKTAAQPKE